MVDEQELWRIIWNRYQEQYPVAYTYQFLIGERVKKMWEDISPMYEAHTTAVFSLEGGLFKSNMLGFMILGAIGEVVFENLAKYLVSSEVMKTIEANVVKSAKESIKNENMQPSELLISVIDCPDCEHPNDPNSKFCSQCGNKLAKD